MNKKVAFDLPGKKKKERKKTKKENKEKKNALYF